MASDKSTHHSTDFLHQTNVVLSLSQRAVDDDLLDRRDRQFQFFFEQASDAMIVAESQGQCLEVNPAACNLFGLSQEQLLQHKITDFFEPGFDTAHIWEQLQQQQRLTGTTQIICANGILHNIEYSATANLVPHRFLFVMRDVTQPSTRTNPSDRHSLSDPLQQRQEIFHTSQTNLANTQRLTQVGNWEFDNQTQTMRWSEELFRIFGCDPKRPEPTLAEHIDAIHPDDQDYWQHTVQRAFLTGESYIIEFRIVRPDGTIRTVEARGESVLDATGQVVKLFGTVQDISDRKQLELALRQQAERERLVGRITQRVHQSLNVSKILDTAVVEVKNLLQADRVLMYQFNPDFSGTVVVESVAPGWLSIFSQTIIDPCFSQEYIRKYQQGYIKALVDIYAPNTHPCYIRLLTPLQVRALLTIPVFKGKTLWGLLIVHQCSAPRHWQAWEIGLIQQLAVQLGIALQQGALYRQMRQLNSTLEQQVELRTAQLRQASDHEALLRRITDQVRDSLDETQILRTAVQELALALDVKCCDTGLYDPDHTTSTIFYDYTVDLPSAQGKVIPIHDSLMHHQLLQGQWFQFCFLSDAQVNVRDETQPFVVLAVPILENQTVLGDLWLFKQSYATFSDMEVRLVEQVANQCAIALRQSRLYQEVQTQVKELARLNSLKDDFLSTVSHELRAPMANIKMASQMIEIFFKPLNITDKRIHRYFKILDDECQREIELINDLLDLSRLEMGRAELDITSVNLQHWLPHIAEPFLERAEQQQQQLVIDIMPGIGEIMIDLSYLERILTELLHNACKYTPAGERIVVSVQGWAEYVQIQVTNTGVQIPDEERDRIFEKFYRVPNNDPWKHGGTGLGLALVKKMADLMGISIQLGAIAGQTTFTLHIPLMLHYPENC